MDVSILAEQNPWWKGREHICEDYDILRWNEKRHRWNLSACRKII
ncbi:MAG: hypothetical protein QME12_03585 [Nanoarchaeota archaeon]|nr:hypothetical protein [Nanoarchaeota archaeon]